MSVSVKSGDSSALLTIDPTFKAARVSLRPPEVLGWNSVGAPTGAMTGIAAAGPIFSLRNISSNLLMVRRVGFIGVVSTALAATTFSHGLYVARSFTASDSGGTAIALTGNNGKHRTSLATPTSLDMRIATTGALTAGTRTLDTNGVGISAGWFATAGGVFGGVDNLLNQDPGDHPIILAQNEGLVITNLIAMSTGVLYGYVNIEFAELSSY